jgi:hypothetical protein
MTLIDPATMARTEDEILHVATSPELALGQGTNRGVMVEMATDELEGQVNTAKPTWDHLYGQGEAELLSKYVPQQKYQAAVRSITVRPDAAGPRYMVRRLRQGVIPRLKEAGWTEQALPDGSIKITRPPEMPHD